MKKILPLHTRLTGINFGIPVEQLYSKYKTAESGILKVEGMDLHYRVTGSGMPLLLIHGVTSSLHTWSGWHEHLSTHFQVISFDVPCFGLTGPHPKGDYSLEMYMRVIDKLLEHLKVEKLYLAGNSFGGYLAWNYALYQSSKVLKMILLDAAGIGSKRSDLKDIGFKVFLNPITKIFAHRFTPRGVLKNAIRMAYGDPSKVTEETIDTYHHLLLRKGNRQGFSVVLDKTILHGQDNTLKIKQIRTPTLIMWGDKDKTIRVKDAYRFKELISGSELIVYKNIGHIPMEEIPKETAADALAFLQKIT